MWEDPCPCVLNERNPFFSHLNHLKTQCGRSTVTRYVQSLCPPSATGCFSPAPALSLSSSRSGFSPEVYRVAIICSAGVWFSLKLQIEVDASSDKTGQLGLSLLFLSLFHSLSHYQSARTRRDVSHRTTVNTLSWPENFYSLIKGTAQQFTHLHDVPNPYEFLFWNTMC